MKHLKTAFIILLTYLLQDVNAQENNDQIEFNDNQKSIHGIYFGVGGYYGAINKKDTYATAVKFAYVANQQFEIGFGATGFYTDKNKQGLSKTDNDAVGVYEGFHLEPILFSKSKVNLSFPLLIGAGALTVIQNNNSIYEDEDWNPVFVLEPGASITYNINKFIQNRSY